MGGGDGGKAGRGQVVGHWAGARYAIGSEGSLRLFWKLPPTV